MYQMAESPLHGQEVNGGKVMFRKIALAASAAAMVAIPATADAQYYGGYRYHHYRPRVRTVISIGTPGYGYYGGYAPYGYSYPAYGYGYGYHAYGYGYGYGYPAYGYGYPAYGYPSYGYNYPAYGYGYGYPSYGYGGYGYCRNNTAAGAAVGGIAGAAIGSSVASDGRHYSRYGYRGYRGGGDRAAGAIIGGVLGAVAGAAVADSAC